MQPLQNARRAAPGGSRGGWVANISPYKDGAYPRSDANSFPICTLNIRHKPRGKGAAETKILELPYCPRPSFSVSWQVLAAVSTSLKDDSFLKPFNSGSPSRAEYPQ